MTTYASLVTRIRRSLNETTAQEWDDDAQIIPEISLAERWFAQWLGRRRNSGRFEYVEDFSVSADTETFALSGLTKALVSIRSLEMQTTGGRWVPLRQLPAGDEYMYREATSVSTSPNVQPAYRLEDSNIRFLPTSSQARTMKALYNWIPAAKTSGATLETPAEYDDIIFSRVLWVLLGEEGESESTFTDRYASRFAEIEGFETNRNRTSAPEQIKNHESRILFDF